MEMTTDEINEGLARYLWPNHDIHVGRSVLHMPQEHALFTDSLDACSKVADKLGVSDIEFQVDEPGRHWCGVGVILGIFTDAYGPTRSHALAAALWAAVQEQGDAGN